ncbi:uncharacterized protein VTP21DRAFT_10733 [Calcarisporiella thermophila]|uniref:uncharacterized protein n=1 Tax=Calcarisporiella thermophila TaxID=911321 RepID=UPI0037445F2F
MSRDLRKAQPTNLDYSFSNPIHHSVSSDNPADDIDSTKPAMLERRVSGDIEVLRWLQGFPKEPLVEMPSARPEVEQRIAKEPEEEPGARGNGFGMGERGPNEEVLRGLDIRNAVLEKDVELLPPTLSKGVEGNEKNEAPEKDPEIKIHDFAFHSQDPRHYGLPPPAEQISPRINAFVGSCIVATRDYEASAEGELSFSIGDMFWVQYGRQCPGWILVESERGEFGLVPKSHISVLEEREEEEAQKGLDAEEQWD